MAKEYAAQFYKSKAWQNTRAAYISSRGGLCERCLARGKYNPGVIVHHREHITPDNIQDPNVLLSWENLELLCRECHAAEHAKNKKRFFVDDAGHVTPLSEK